MIDFGQSPDIVPSIGIAHVIPRALHDVLGYAFLREPIPSLIDRRIGLHGYAARFIDLLFQLLRSLFTELFCMDVAGHHLRMTRIHERGQFGWLRIAVARVHKVIEFVQVLYALQAFGITASRNLLWAIVSSLHLLRLGRQSIVCHVERQESLRILIRLCPIAGLCMEHHTSGQHLPILRVGFQYFCAEAQGRALFAATEQPLDLLPQLKCIGANIDGRKPQALRLFDAADIDQ